MEYYILGLLVACCLGILPANIAKRKGKDFTTWWVYGTFLWIVAIFHAISLPELPVSNSPSDNLSYKLFENTELVKKQPINKVDLASPVEIKSYEIYKNAIGEVYLKIQFKNLGVGVVSALAISVIGENAFGEPIFINDESVTEFTIQDLNVAKNIEFENTIPIKLPSNDIRQVSLNVKKVLFSDQGNVNIDSLNILPSKEFISTTDILKCAKSISNVAQCFYTENSDYWVCTCGRPNTLNSKNCINCSFERSFVSENFSKEKLINKIFPDYLDKQKKLHEQEKVVLKNKQELQLKKEQEDRIKRNKLLKYTCGGVSLVCITIFLISNLYSIISQNRAEQLSRENQIKNEQLLIEEQNKADQLLKEEHEIFNHFLKDKNISIEQLIQEEKYEQAFDTIVKEFPTGTSLFPDDDKLILKMQQQYYSRLDSNNEILQVDGVKIYDGDFSIFSIDESNNKTIYFTVPKDGIKPWRLDEDRKCVIDNNIMYSNGFILFKSDEIGERALYIVNFKNPSEKFVRLEYGASGKDNYVDSFTKLEDGNILLGFKKSKIQGETTLILFAPKIEEKFVYLTKEEFENTYNTKIPSSIGLVSFADIIDSVDYVYTTRRDM